ncbi:MAG TPA: M20/M25/M40 family metallo-hydrolase, partial [Candidatus Acidoferrum sp.]|nr:M20/M25/M40 family metallo-hydrolase [Candidatus Acidoferrum sp.]
MTDRANRAVSPTSRAVLLATILLATGGALFFDRPPPPEPETAPAGEFSAMRALAHLRVIAAAPRPIGSEGHAKALAYIVETLRANGLEPEIQAARFPAPRSGASRDGRVQNVVAVLPGRRAGRGPALLLASHHDSVTAGPGASDDGAAVAAMLETLRALRSGPPLANDIVFLFTDAEELGLDGARAFAAEHALAGRIGVALNFEARGSRGPVFMFQTSGDNGWLIDQLAASAPHIAATSLAGEVYRRMPNDTDFTVFLARGMSGMNFAYIGGVRHYHTAGDTIENLDLGSLQHHGSYMLALARRLGDADLSSPRGPDAVYFSLAGDVFVHYSSAWVQPLLALAGLVFLAALVHGVRRGLIRWRALASLGLLVAVMVVTGLALAGVTLAVVELDPHFTPTGEHRAVYDGGAYMLAFAALAAVIAAALYALSARLVSAAELAAGALAGW